MALDPLELSRLEVKEQIDLQIAKKCKMSSNLAHYFVVISDLTRCKHYEDLDKFLIAQGYEFYYIKHDKDNSKFVHCHLLLDLPHSKLAKTIVNQLSKFLECNEENIQLMGVNNHALCVQYLIHLNNPHKHKYDISEIVSNSSTLDAELCTKVIIKNQLTTEDLVQYIFYDKMNRLDLIVRIGIGAYQHYRSTIMDMYSVRDRYIKDNH